MNPAVALALLAVLLGIPIAAAQTFDEAAAAYERRDYATAVRGFRVHAEQGLAEAQLVLGLMYSIGEGVPKNDAEAVKWFRKAAEQSHDNAQFNLGVKYAEGEGVPENDAEAVKWFRKAAEQGNATAQGILGIMYDNGRGVPENDVEAVKWFRKAAEQGNATAQGILGIMYDNGTYRSSFRRRCDLFCPSLSAFPCFVLLRPVVGPVSRQSEHRHRQERHGHASQRCLHQLAPVRPCIEHGVNLPKRIQLLG